MTPTKESLVSVLFIHIHGSLIKKNKNTYTWFYVSFFSSTWFVKTYYLVGVCVVEEALNHPYLAKLHDPNDEPICLKPFSFDFEQQPLDEEQIKEMIYREAIALNPTYA